MTVYKIKNLILGFVLVEVYYNGIITDARITRPYSKYLNEIGARIKYWVDSRKGAYGFEFPNGKIFIYVLEGNNELNR